MPEIAATMSADAPVTLEDCERQPCEVWTRVMGYHRPIASFNIGKQGEHEARRSFVIKETWEQCPAAT